jgi:UDP:flavonoid glycosyltransferase YjiC (YdhE family)
MIIPEQMQMNVECFGPIMIRDHSDTMSWSEARSYLGVEPAQKIAYVTAGGGGDEQAHKTLLRLVHAVTRAGVKPFIGAGPLYKGPRIYEAGSVWLSEIAVIRLMNAFDFAISAAGYNSFSELMYMGVPTIFYAQERIADSQGSRARKAAATGAALFVENIHTANLREAIENILRDAVRKRLSRNARELVPENYASHCAASLYRKFLSE